MGPEVAARFGLGTVTGQVTSAARGAMGEIFKVPTESGTFAVKRLFAWNDGSGAEAEAAFTELAREAGIFVPCEIRSTAGALVEEVSGVRFRVWEWFDLDPVFARPADACLAERLGAVLGALHAASLPDNRPLDPWYTAPPAEERWLSLASQIPVDLSAVKALASRYRAGERITCHRDFAPSNVYGCRGQLALLDWEDAGPCEATSEVAWAILRWCTDDTSLDLPSLRAFLDGYGRHQPRPDIGMDDFAMAAVVWLNFLAAQAEVAGDADARPEDREYARQKVSELLGQPLSPSLLSAIVEAARADAVG